MPLTRASEAYATKWEVLVFGVPGVGKTTLFASAPNVLYISVDENGHIVLQDHPKAKDITVFHTRSWKELVAFVVDLPRNELVKEVDTIVVDTISECQTLHRLVEIGGGKVNEEGWKFNQYVYTVNNFKVQALIRGIKAARKNVAWLCHMTTDQIIDSRGNVTQVVTRPALSATLLAAVQTNIDGQFYYKRSGSNRILETDGSGEVQTKSRFRLSRPLQNPTWEQLEKLLTSRMKGT